MTPSEHNANPSPQSTPPSARLDALDQCIAVLNVSPDSHVCTEVFHALVRSRDPRAVIPIVLALPRFQTLGYENENRIKRQLAKFGEAAVPPLIQLFQSDKIRIRRYAVELLGDQKDVRAIPTLAQALQDVDEGVRHKTVLALAQFQPDQSQFLLILALQDADSLVRDAAALVLDKPVFLQEQAVVEALITARKDPSGRVRGRALRALTECRDTRMAAFFLEGMYDEHDFVRSCAVRALGKRKEAQAIPRLITALKDTASQVQENAAEALLQFGNRDALVLALLTTPQLPLSAKLDTLTALLRTRFDFKHIQADYRSRSVTHYCQELLQKDLPPLSREAVLAVQAQIGARRDKKVLLRASNVSPGTQQLLRPTRPPSTTHPAEMLRSSDGEERATVSRPSWFARMFRNRS